MKRPLNEKQERLLLLFMKAIQGERDAQSLYADMLTNCDDPDLREILVSFRDQEQAHETRLLDELLRAQKDQQEQGLSAGGGPREYRREGTKARIRGLRERAGAQRRQAGRARTAGASRSPWLIP